MGIGMNDRSSRSAHVESRIASTNNEDIYKATTTTKTNDVDSTTSHVQCTIAAGAKSSTPVDTLEPLKLKIEFDAEDVEHSSTRIIKARAEGHDADKTQPHLPVIAGKFDDLHAAPAGLLQGFANLSDPSLQSI